MWKFNDPTNGWMFIGFICLFSVLAMIFYLMFDEAKDKHPSRFVRGLFQLPFWATSLIVFTLVTTPPDNWQPSAAQGTAILITLVVIVIVALLLLRKYRKKLSATVSSTNLDNSTKSKTKGNSHKQPQHSSKTKKANENGA